MGFTLAVEGGDNMYFGEEVIQSVQFVLATPSDSRARSTNNCVTMLITGKLYVDSPAEGCSESIGLAKWAQVAAESDEAYRKVTVEVVSTGVCFRKIQIPKAFVIDYSERYAVQHGVGEFSMTIRQKADKIADLQIDGAVAAASAGAAAESGSSAKETAAKKSEQLAAQKALENAGKAAAMAAVQNVLNKVDTSGTASAALGGAMMTERREVDKLKKDF